MGVCPSDCEPPNCFRSEVAFGEGFISSQPRANELCGCLDHLLDAAGNPGLMTTELKVTVAEHAAGNYRVMMNIADELLVAAAERNLPQLDEKLYFDVFQVPATTAKRPVGKKR